MAAEEKAPIVMYRVRGEPHHLGFGYLLKHEDHSVVRDAMEESRAKHRTSRPTHFHLINRVFDHSPTQAPIGNYTQLYR